MGRFLGLSTGETLRTWTVLETIIAVAGLTFILVAYGLVGLGGYLTEKPTLAFRA